MATSSSSRCLYHDIRDDLIPQTRANASEFAGDDLRRRGLPPPPGVFRSGIPERAATKRPAGDISPAFTCEIAESMAINNTDSGAIILADSDVQRLEGKCLHLKYHHWRRRLQCGSPRCRGYVGTTHRQWRGRRVCLQRGYLIVRRSMAPRLRPTSRRCWSR